MAFLEGVVTRAEREHFKRVLNELRKHYPVAFDPKKPLPLVDDAYMEIFNDKKVDFTIGELGSFFKTWKNRYEYLSAKCLHGKYYYCDGQPADTIDHDECLRLMEKMAKLYIGTHKLIRQQRTK
ncbi:MAG: hypothetical protein ACRDCE_12905 [Cetobacterium sp.]|uniref:hypothetical protein n=1 Tax=Cetobacterium sp. TaxID=2071632 RepID=UPI003EE7684A